MRSLLAGGMAEGRGQSALEGDFRMIPQATDNSPAAQAVRVAAVNAHACPKCGVGQGFGCQPAGGGRYDPRYTVHTARLKLNDNEGMPT